MSSAWGHAGSQQHCHTQQNRILHLMGIQELKRVKSDNRDMNNLHSLNRSRSGFLNCVSCRKGKWEKCQSPSSLHSFGRGIAASVKQRVGKVYPVQAPQGLEPFCCCRQPWLNSWGSIWSQAEVNMKSVSSAAQCHSVLSVLCFSRAGTSHSHSWDFSKAQARSSSQHNQFLLCRWPRQHIESRQHI